jgi:hypothetical protein
VCGQGDNLARHFANVRMAARAEQIDDAFGDQHGRATTRFKTP